MASYTELSHQPLLLPTMCLLLVSEASQVDRLAAHVVVQRTIVVVVDSNSERDVQTVRFEAEALVPFRIQVPVYDGTTVLEATALEFHIRITASCVQMCTRPK